MPEPEDDMSMDLDLDDRRRLLDAACAVVKGHPGRVRDLPVAPPVDTPDVLHAVESFDLEGGADPVATVNAVGALLEETSVLTTHPRYFGLFNPSPLAAGIAADILTAGFNPQLAVWSHAPAAVEIEARLIREVGGWLNIADATGSFTTGGTEANLTATLLALHAHFPSVSSDGIRSIPGRATLYASQDSHLAWLKIAHLTGLGRRALRLVPCDGSLRMDLDALRDMLAADRASGALPFMVIATAGTTSAGIIDPLEGAAAIASRNEIWFHVDAAWAGAAACSRRLRHHLRGVEGADSVTVDAHKWLSVPMGAGMFICRHADALRAVFDVSASYMPLPTSGGALDPYVTSVQWSRRAAGLKLFLTLAVHGRRAYAQQIEDDVRLGSELRAALQADDWRVLNDTPLPVVCVTDPRREGDAAFHEGVAAAVVDSGRAWVSAVQLGGAPAVRACVISHETEESDIRSLVTAMRRARSGLADG
jgi:aromatic-L-amino-acid/L-tryptophan decarboxylase